MKNKKIYIYIIFLILIIAVGIGSAIFLNNMSSKKNQEKNRSDILAEIENNYITRIYIGKNTAYNEDLEIFYSYNDNVENFYIPNINYESYIDYNNKIRYYSNKSDITDKNFRDFDSEMATNESLKSILDDLINKTKFVDGNKEEGIISLSISNEEYNDLVNRMRNIKELSMAFSDFFNNKNIEQDVEKIGIYATYNEEYLTSIGITSYKDNSNIISFKFLYYVEE